MIRSMLCAALMALAVACATGKSTAYRPEPSDMVAVRVDTKGAKVAIPEGWTYTSEANGSLVLRPPKGEEVDAFEEQEKLAAKGIAAAILYTMRDDLCPGTFAQPAKDDHQWHLKHINVFEAWKLAPPPGGAQLGEGVKVCQVDTGYTDHPALKDALAERGATFFGGYSEAKPLLDARDSLSGLYGGHGTGTGALIAGLEGVAPKAKLLPIRVTDNVILQHETEKYVARGIRYAIRSGCRVINLSLGAPFTLPGEDDMRNAVFEAAASGIIVVAGAGQCFGNVVQPAAYQGAIAVGATDVFDQPWRRSSDGPSVVIAAPGDTIWAARANWDGEGGYDHNYGTGTSYSSALVSGSAALWLAFNGADIQRAYPDPSDVPRAFRWLLHNRAFRQVDWKQLPNRAPWRMGSGILDVKMLLGAKLPTLAQLQSEPALNKEDRLVYARRRFHEMEERGELSLNISAKARAELEKDAVALQELLFMVQERQGAQAGSDAQAKPAVALDAKEVRQQLCDHCARLKGYLAEE